MTRLTTIEMLLVDEMFDMGSGHVGDLTWPDFKLLFAVDVGVDIMDAAYELGSSSKGKRLRAFMERAQPLAIATALTALWAVREDRKQRMDEAETITDARRRLSAVIERLGGMPLEGVDAEALAREPAKTPRPSSDALRALAKRFQEMHELEAQPRGYAFELFLKEYFDLWGLEAKGSFRNLGEQIDGSFVHDGAVYLLEAKWRAAPSNANDLHAFEGKCTQRQIWSRGLFVSYNGFSPEAFDAFTPRSTVLMSGEDIHHSLELNLPLGDVLDAKLRDMTDRNAPFARVRDLFRA